MLVEEGIYCTEKLQYGTEIKKKLNLRFSPGCLPFILWKYNLKQ